MVSFDCGVVFNITLNRETQVSNRPVVFLRPNSCPTGCSSSLTCVNKYMAIDIGVRIIFSQYLQRDKIFPSELNMMKQIRQCKALWEVIGTRCQIRHQNLSILDWRVCNKHINISISSSTTCKNKLTYLFHNCPHTSWHRMCTSSSCHCWYSYTCRHFDKDCCRKDGLLEKRETHNIKRFTLGSTF